MALAGAGIVEGILLMTRYRQADRLTERIIESANKLSQYDRATLPALGVRTADPFRTLIQMGGYEGDEKTAAKMEKTIATARAAFSSGLITTSEGLEANIVSSYTSSVRQTMSRNLDRFGNPLRDYGTFLGLGQQKHVPYILDAQVGTIFNRLKQKVDIAGRPCCRRPGSNDAVVFSSWHVFSAEAH